MSKFKTIDSFFKRKEADISESNTLLDFNVKTSNVYDHHLQSPRVEDRASPMYLEALGEILKLDLIFLIFKY
jgi:hypothetical protein